jgi:acetyl esterase/lipase
MPNYRLAPEHTGDDILEDIADFWTWLRSSLPTYLAFKELSISPDLSNVLVHGESAGGWCALQSILTQPKSTFKACFLQYPVVNAFPTSPDDIIMGESLPPKEVLDEFLASLVPGTMISSVTPPARDFVAPMLRAYKRWGEFFGTGKHIMPDTAFEDAKFFVPTYIVHGRDDTNVPVKWTHEFVEKARKVLPEAKFMVVTPPGDHGFDGAIYEDEPWLKQVLKGVERDWLA